MKRGGGLLPGDTVGLRTLLSAALAWQGRPQGMHRADGSGRLSGDASYGHGSLCAAGVWACVRGTNKQHARGLRSTTLALRLACMHLERNA